MAVPRWWFAPPRSNHRRGAGTKRQDQNRTGDPAVVASLVALDPGWDRSKGLAPPGVLAWCERRLNAIEHPPRRWALPKRRRSTDKPRRPAMSGNPGGGDDMHVRPEHLADRRSDPQATLPLEALESSGLLWLVNRAALQPRGFQIHLVRHGAVVIGWQLHGDGTEPWSFDEVIDDDGFARSSAFLDRHTRKGQH